MKNYFKEVVGQKRAKTELSFYIDNHLGKNAVVPHILFTGSKGDGKTHIAKKFAKNLPDLDEPDRSNKAFYLVNASEILNTTIFFEDICAKTQDKYATIFIDEAHELPRKVQTALLSVLEPNRSNKTQYVFNDVAYDFDFSKITFLMATTEEDKIFHALKDRLVNVPLEPYTQEDLREIIEISINNKVEFADGVLDDVARHVRRNARSAGRVAENILKMGHGIFRFEHLEHLKKSINLFPYGVTHNEIRALEILESDGECSLGHLSSRLGQSARAVQKDVESYLIAIGMMSIDGKRRISPKGRNFLNEIGQDQKREILEA